MLVSALLVDFGEKVVSCGMEKQSEVFNYLSSFPMVSISLIFHFFWTFENFGDLILFLGTVSP